MGRARFSEELYRARLLKGVYYGITKQKKQEGRQEAVKVALLEFWQASEAENKKPYAEQRPDPRTSGTVLERSSRQ